MKQLQYTVILNIPKEIEREIELLRDKYNNSESAIVPHLTLKQPFRLLASEKVVTEKLESIAKSTKSFIIFLNGLSYFEDEKNTIYIAVKNKIPVTELHRRIVYALQGCINDVYKEPYELERFIPHITIGENIMGKDFNTAKKELLSYSPTYSLPISAFSLYSADNSLRWELFEKFNLR